MKNSWLDRLRDRIRSTWDVLTGRAYAAYSVPDHMSEVRLRIAAEHVCWFDWSNNDDDAVAAVENLRRALGE